jgi:hypothetical protein
MHASGITWNGYDFTRINSCNPYIVETTVHVREKINFWNICVQEWLRKCIYQRSTIKSKALKQLYVFTISAFWHGFYAAYYISFVLWFSQLYLQGLIFKYMNNGRSLWARAYNKAGKVGYVLLSLIVQIIFSHGGVYFMVLSGPYCIKMLIFLKGVPQLILFLGIVIFSVVRPPRAPKAKVEEG